MRLWPIIAVVPLVAAAGAAPTAPYHLVREVAIGAPERWDYVTYDAAQDRVFIAHGDRVTVVDNKTAAVVGDVEGMPGGTHGIAFADGKGYTDDGRAGVAVVFDLKTLKPIKTIKAEPDADGIVFDRPSGHLMVIDGDSGKVTVIDPKSDDVVATVAAGEGLEFGVSGDNGKFYVDGVEKGEIVRIDTAANKVDARWPLTGCERPHGLAIDVKTMRLFASCANKVMVVVDARTGAVLASEPIGDGTDFAVFDPVRRRAFSSNRDGTVSIVAEKGADGFASLPPLTTAFGARTMAIDPASGRLFLVTADFDVDPAATNPRQRYKAKPGTVRLLIFDPSR